MIYAAIYLYNLPTPFYMFNLLPLVPQCLLHVFRLDRAAIEGFENNYDQVLPIW
jgi:hypothetical protein